MSRWVDEEECLVRSASYLVKKLKEKVIGKRQEVMGG